MNLELRDLLEFCDKEDCHMHESKVREKVEIILKC